MIVLASVPHSGSRFVLKLLPQPVFFRHVYEGESIEQIVALSRAYPVVVPLRHPLAVAQSWKDRGKPIASHPKHEPMVAMWRTLIDVVDPLYPRYLPIDVPDRDAYFAGLETDWVPVKDSNPHVPLTDEDRAAVSELLADPFFARFGYF